MIGHALDLGVNFIDTSPAYALGASEELIGQAVKNRRSEVIIATKFGATSQVGPGERLGSRSYIRKSIELSLKRLSTDYIDLFIVHNPDPRTPVSEMLEVLDGLVRAGDVRYLACSNFAADQLIEAMMTSLVGEVASFVAAGAPYNLLQRDVEGDLVPTCLRYDLSLIPTLPLAGGVLTGKYDRLNPPRLGTPPSFKADRRGRHEDAPSMKPRNLSRYWSALNLRAVERCVEFAASRGHTVGELAIAWLLAHPWVASAIPGAMSITQVSANVAASRWSLTTDDLADLDNYLSS